MIVMPNRIPSYQEYMNFVQQMGGGNAYMSPFNSTQNAQPQTGGGNILPPQQVLQANGKASIDALRMSPNSSVLIMDTTAPIVWLCVSDSLGNVTPTPYDITPHKDAPVPDVSDFASRLEAVENNVNGILAKWEGLNHDSKPDVASAE